MSRCKFTHIAATIFLWAVTVSCNEAGSGDANGHCILQTKKQSSRALMKDRSTETQPYGKAPVDLQAPKAGGKFSEYFNNHTEGRGIHKWLQYFPAYQQHFQKFIGKEVHILEIGIQSGGSLGMWKEVFGPGAFVYGCDIAPHTKNYEDDRTKVFIGDQASEQFWLEVKKQVPRIDILIDDGGHAFEQMAMTLGLMLRHTSGNGVYVIEDVHDVPGANGEYRQHGLWQTLQFEKLEVPSKGKIFTGLSDLVASVHVYPNLLVIERDRNPTTMAQLQQPVGQPIDAQLVVEPVKGLPEKDFPNAPLAQVKGMFPSLHWAASITSDGHDFLQLVGGLQPKSWLFVTNSSSKFTLGAPWDAQSDALMSSSFTQFMHMHEGECCDWRANAVQQQIDSLHIYPNLLIAKRTDGQQRLMKAPQHGSLWA